MKDDKFILMGLNDDKARDIAEILKNKTAKKILDYLGDVKEASEKDISDGIESPINTIEYNLKKLVKSGLVKKTSNFFWSVKGKKIPMYKIARKHIVISTGKKPDLSSLKSVLHIVFLSITLILLASIFIFPLGNSNRETDQTKLNRFNSINELKEFLADNSNNEYLRGFRGETGISALESADKASSESIRADSYSTTNIQVKGVDEADIVKNDGKYIYIVSGNKVYIVNAFPANEMSILSEIEFEKNVNLNQIFIRDDKLIVFGNVYGYYGDDVIAEETIDSRVIAPETYPVKSRSLVYIYNINNRENLIINNKIEFDGDYIDARLIDNYVYLISNKYIDVNNPEPPVYILNDKEIKSEANDVYYFDNRDYNYVFTTISSINVENGDVNNKIYLTGGSGNIYVSKDNIYLTYQKSISQDDYLKKFADQVVLKLMPDKRYEILEIVESKEYVHLKLSKINEMIYENSLSLKGEEKERYDKNLKELSELFQESISKEMEKTIIHKININKGNINYKSNGEVPGIVLNQFSMDENNGYFRIAVTTGNRWRDTNLNHLYILDEDLEIVGKLEDLAKNERIYSVRFIDKRAYMVTFRQIDPFYVIDLESPRNPRVLGFLKITGYSSYLHPYDNNHIIGIGMEANEEGREEGVKIALFDVSDVENPRLLSKYLVNSEFPSNYNVYSSSESIYEHKSFLFNKEKELLVIPISYNIYSYDSKNMEYWQGAYVFKINLDELILRGKISHSEDDNYWMFNVRRSLFINEALYTISDFKIKANDLLNLNEIRELVLRNTEPVYYDDYMIK